MRRCCAISGAFAWLSSPSRRLAAFSAACVAFAVRLIVATSTSVAFVGASCTFLAVAIAVVTIIAILSSSCRRRCDPRCDCRLAVARRFIDIVVVVVVAAFVVVDPLDRRFRRRSSRSTLSPSSLLAIDARRRRSSRSTLAIVALAIVASRDRRSRDRRISSLQKLGWLLRAPSHRSFSVVASCDRWGGKIRSSSSRSPPFAARSGALTRGQRPKIKFYCRVRSPHRSPCPF